MQQYHMNLHLLIEKFESFAHSHISLFKLIALSIVVLSALGLTACGEDEPDVAEEAEEAVLVLTPSMEELDFDTDLSDIEFILASNADVQYKVVIPSDCQWLSVDKSSGSIAATKSVTLKFSVDRKKVNAGEYGTSVTITAGEKEMVLPVALVVPLEVTADVTNLDFGTDLSEMRVNINSNGNVQLDVTIPSDYGWLMVTPNTANIIAGSTTVLNFKAIRKGLYPGIYSSNIVVKAGDKTLMLNSVMEVTEFDPYGRCGSITPCDSRLPVTFTGCRRVGNDVVLEYTVTNNGPTAIKMFKLWTNQNYTSFIDNHHNSYTNLTGITHTLGSNSGTGDIFSPIPQGGTIRCKSVVKNVASAASSFDVVTLRLYNYGTGDWECANKTVTFRNVVWG